MDSLHLIAAADSHYRIQLDVMLTSVRVHLPARVPIHATVLSSELQTADITWARRGPLDTLSCATPEIGESDTLPIHEGDHLSVATYFRLYMAHAVSASVDRVIYLDCDLVVTRSLLELMQADLGGKTVGAVRAYGIPSLRASGPAFADADQGDTKPYFNAGVLVIDMARWRKAKVQEKACRFLTERHSQVKYWDQDALNYVLQDDWHELDPRWNRTSDYHRVKWSPNDSAFTKTTWLGLREPYVAHFVSGYKPWSHYGHPDKRLYDRYLKLAGHGKYRMTLWKALRRRWC